MDTQPEAGSIWAHLGAKALRQTLSSCKRRRCGDTLSCTHWRSTAEGEDSKSAACCFDCSSSNVAYENITTSEGAACAEVAGRGWSGSFVVQSSHFRACRFQAPTSMNSDAMAVDEERGAQSTTQCWGTTTTAPFCAARAVTQPLYCPAPRGAAARDNRRRSETTPEHQELSSILNIGHPPSCRVFPRRMFDPGAPLLPPPQAVKPPLTLPLWCSRLLLIIVTAFQRCFISACVSTPKKTEASQAVCQGCCVRARWVYVSVHVVPLYYSHPALTHTHRIPRQLIEAATTQRRVTQLGTKGRRDATVVG